MRLRELKWADKECTESYGYICEGSPSNKGRNISFQMFILKLRSVKEGNPTKSKHMCSFISQLGQCTPKDSDTCLWETETDTGIRRWNNRYTCSVYAPTYCKNYEKDFKRCCPISCDVEKFTEDECNKSSGRGTCTYPNKAQCPENG